MKRFIMIIVIGFIFYPVNSIAQDMNAMAVQPMAPAPASMSAPVAAIPAMAASQPMAIIPIAAMAEPKPTEAKPILDSGVKEQAMDAGMDIDTKEKAEVPSAEKNEAKETSWDKADKWIGRISGALLSLLSFIAIILGWTIGNGWKKNQRLKKVLEYADKAFPIVENLAKKTGWKGDDKLVQFLKRISDWLKVEGDMGLNEEEISILKKEAADRAAQLKIETGGVVKEDLVKRG